MNLDRGGSYGGNQASLLWALDQALGEVAQNLRILRNEYGPETLAFTHGTYRTYNCDGWRFFNLFGSLNMCGASNVCMCPTQAVESLRLSFSS